MKKIIITIFLGLLFSACSPDANFTDKNVALQSLTTGETVEMVSNDDLDALLEQTDEGVSQDVGTTMTNDDGNNTQMDIDSPKKNEPRHVSIDNDDKKKDVSDVKKENSSHPNCLDRLDKQVKEKKPEEMVIAPKEIDEDERISQSLSCGKKSDKKVLVCHFPNGDYAKRKTLCIGSPALDAHLKHNDGSDHKDFAGACQ